MNADDPTRPYHPHDTPGGNGTFPPDAAALLAGLGLAGPDTAVANTGFVVHAPAAPPPDVPGFEILGELGAGGMGVVYQAREVALNRVVALKMIRPDARPGAADLARFRAEAEAVAAVRHPNVVEVYSTGTADGRPYFVMEYVAGGSLARRLAASGPLAPREAAAVAAAVARGVHAAHAAGIVHRDLKPGNILLVDSGQWTVDSEESKRALSGLSTVHCPLSTPKVSDFGLAKRLCAAGDGITRSVAVVGTPAYMAPEQARGRGKFVGPEADVYALGVVLYECLTGRPPFRDDDALALMRMVAEDAPAPPRTVVAAVPRDLDLICRKCLAKEPRDRYATAADLAADLDRFLAGVPVAARPIPWPVRAARWVRRNPAPAALAALLLLALTLGPAGLVAYRSEKKVLEANDEARRQAVLRAEADAARARDEKTAAERLAAARELVALQGAVRRREADRPTGWTWANRADLRRAAGLAGGDPAALAALRAEAATALLAADLRPTDPVARGFTAGAAASSPDGTRVALGELNAWGAGGVLGKLAGAVAPLRVLLLDPAGAAPPRELGLAAGAVYRDGAHVPDRITALAFSPDGKRLYAGTRSARVARFDLDAPGAAAAKVWKAPDTVGHLAATAGGAVLGGCGRHLLRWDAATGAEAARVEAPNKVGGLAVDPGGATVLAAYGGTVARGAVAAPEFPPDSSGSNAPYARLPTFVAGGRVLAVARDNRVELRDPADLRPVARFADPALLDRDDDDELTAVAAHPSGAYLATASADRAVRVWAVASGVRVAAVQLAGTGPAALAWAGDGRTLFVTGPNQTARFEFAPPPAERVAGLQPHPLAAAAPAPGGRVVGLGELVPEPQPGQALFRTAPDGTPDAATRLDRDFALARAGLAVNPVSGAAAATGHGHGVLVWDPARPDGPRLIDPALAVPCRCPAASPDGKALWAVVDSRFVRAWDTATGAPLGGGWENEADGVVAGQAALDALAAGRTVGVAGGAAGGVHVLAPAAAGKVAYFPGARDPVQAVALAPAEDFAAAGTQGGKLRAFRLADRAELPPVPDAHPGGVTAVAFAPDGAVLATGGRDRAVRFWTRMPAGGFEPAAAVTGLPGPVRTLAFDPAGALVVVLAGDRAARVWDAARLRADLADLGLDW